MGMQIVSRLRQNQFLRHNAIFFVGSLAVGALNYLYYPVLGRLLQPTAFGEVQTLVSLFLQLNIFLTVFGLVTANIAANYNDAVRRNYIIFELERIALGISAVLLLVSLVFGTQLQGFFRFDSSWPFVVLVLAVVINVPATLRTSFVCGQHGFGIASVSNLLVALAKIIFSAGLAAIGLSTLGAIWGVAAAQFLALCYIAYWAHRLGLERPAGASLLAKPDFGLIGPELKYAGFVLVGSLIITLQFSIDILVVKHYFDAYTAGLYAAIATVARIIFFVTGSLAQVLMPSVKLQQAAARNRQLLFMSFGLLAATSLPLVLIFAFFPGTIVSVLMGGKYATFAGLLPWLSLAIFMIAAVNLLISYHMALRHYRSVLIVGVGAVLTYGLMLVNHANLSSVIGNVVYGSLSMLVLIACVTAWPGLIKKKAAGVVQS